MAKTVTKADGTTVGMSDRAYKEKKKSGEIDSSGTYRPKKKTNRDDDNAYRASLTDPNNTPTGLSYGTGTSSMDLIKPPTFEKTDSDNLMRIDYTPGGEHRTLIPNLNWRMTQGGNEDPDLGQVYNKQNSAYGFTTRFDRSRDADKPPAGYVPGAADSWLNNSLAKANSTPLIPSVPAQNSRPSPIPPISGSNTMSAPMSSKPPLIPSPQGGGSLAQFGGAGAYAASQGNRYNAAQQAGDAGLMQRLEADAARVGYSLPLIPQVPSTPTATAGAYTSIPSLTPAPPEMDLYRPRTFDADRHYEAPDVGGKGITWLPTNQAISQFNQNEQAKYNASLDQYNADYGQWKDQANISWDQYLEQQRQTENQQALAREDAANTSAAQRQQYEDAFSLWTTIGVATPEIAAIIGVQPGTPTSDQSYRDAQIALEQIKTQYQVNKPYYSPNSGGSGGGLTPNQLLNMQGQQVLNSLSPYMMKYKSYNDLMADLPRIASSLPASVTLQDLQKMAEGMKSVYFRYDPELDRDIPITPRDFVPNANQQYGGSPLMAGLANLGGGQQPSSGGQADVTQQKINQARSNGATDAQIRAALQSDGIDPKQYGL